MIDPLFAINRQRGGIPTYLPDTSGADDTIQVSQFPRTPSR